ncbi:MAG: helix-turn-helix transcriptional regulator [Proteobacteria bacterium]|nr:helix-turn-helix transcriptional regulator [Pseudomonadota bacterium]
MMDTRELAEYLRLKERRVYDLVRSGVIPHLRATGKLLFPRDRIDAWLAAKGDAAPPDALPRAHPLTPPAIIAGSHDPLLDWAARASGCGLAILPCGSRAGIETLARGEATAAATHWIDRETGDYNVGLVRETLAGFDAVVLEWARRSQGLLLAEGNPLRIRSIADLRRQRLRVVPRQPDAGSQHLFLHELARAGVDESALDWLPRPALAETDLAAVIAAGRADVGFGIEAVARARGLAFIPVTVERFDLVARRRDAFEPPLQALVAWARTPEFAAEATLRGGYDVASSGRVVLNL